MSAGNSTAPNPEDENNKLLNTTFKFKIHSKLKDIIANKTKTAKTFYSFIEILSILKEVIRDEKMYDQTNPAIIICSPRLENALDMKALHVKQIIQVILPHLEEFVDETELTNHHSIEYVVESDQEETRHAQEKYEKLVSSESDEDGTICNTPSIETRLIELFNEHSYWGDDESELERTKWRQEDFKISDSELKPHHPCNSCKTLKKPIPKRVCVKNFNCTECWQRKRNWLPKRPKQKSTTIKTKQSTTEQKISCSYEINKIPEDYTQLCSICYQRPKNACFIHGKTAHQMSCYQCARKLWKIQSRCPICRRQIDRIVKIN